MSCVLAARVSQTQHAFTSPGPVRHYCLVLTLPSPFYIPLIHPPDFTHDTPA